jgi:hypothetical protein
MGWVQSHINPIPIPESIPFPLDMGLIWDGSIPYLIPYQSQKKHFESHMGYFILVPY